MQTIRMGLVSVALLFGCHHSKHEGDGGTSPSTDLTGAGNQMDFTGEMVDLTGTGGNTDGAMSGTDAAMGGATGDQSVLQRGNDIYRRATFTESGLTQTAAVTMAPDTTFNTNATFPANGSMTGQGVASLLYVEKGPSAAGCPSGATGCAANDRVAGAGLFFAFPGHGASSNIVAMDETSGKTVWTANVSAGNDGVRGTPVIDPNTRLLYAVGGPNPHVVHAVSIDNGVETKSNGWPVTISSSTLSYNNTQFNSPDQNQHSALLLMNNILYIAFGGEDGDGGTYLGWVTALDTTDTSKLAGWATRSSQSGIWAEGGIAADGKYVYAITGNSGAVPARSASDSEEILRVSGMASFNRAATEVFVPTEWQDWDEHDYDFGASSPAVAQLPSGSKYSSLVIAPAKPGRVYILDGSNLSSGTYPSTGGELVELQVSALEAQSVYTSPTIYSTSSGLFTAVNVGSGATNCPSNTPSTNEAIMGIALDPSASPVAKISWCAPGGNNAGGNVNYPPISTTTDGVSGNPIVWYIGGNNSDQLVGVDGATGKNIVTTSGTACGSIPSMNYAIAVKNRIVISALGHLCSWSPGGTF